MKELEEIYEVWDENQDKYPLLRDEWAKLVGILYERCEEEQREEIMSIVVEYGAKIEKYAFIAGFKKAFHLLLDILKN